MLLDLDKRLTDSIMMENEQMQFRWKTSHKDYFLQSLSQLFTSHDLSDVVLVCEDNTQLRAHKVVLRAFSEMFKDIFASNMSSSVIFLRGVRSEMMESILKLLYLGETTISSLNVPEFISVAGSLKISELSDLHNNMIEEMKMKEDIKTEPLTDITSGVNSEEIPGPRRNYTANDILNKMEEKINTRPLNGLSEQNQNRPILKPKPNSHQVQCPKCKVWFRSTMIMESHYQKFHNNKTYSCSFCNFQCKRADSMEEHVENIHSHLVSMK